MVARRAAAACALLTTIATIYAPVDAANQSLCCFQGAGRLPRGQMLSSCPASLSVSPPLSSTVRTTIRSRLPHYAASQADTRRRRILTVVAATKDNEKTADDKDNKEDEDGKKGWFGFGGGDGDKDKDDADEKTDKKRNQRKRNFFRRLADGDKRKDKKEAKGSQSDDDTSESGGFFRRILRSRSGDDDDDEKTDKNDKGDSGGKLSLPSVDINAFVGPRMSGIVTELGVRAELRLTPEEVARKEKARMAMEMAKVRRIEAQKRQEEKVRAAKERAAKLAEERRLAEQKKKEILERQKAVREAAKTKPGSSKSRATDEKSVTDDEKSGRWPNISFGGGDDKSEDKAAAESKRSKSEKNEGGGGVFSGLSAIFGGGSEKEQVGEWIVVCPKTRIMPGVVVPVVAGGLDLLIVASKDGRRLACISNSCPHLGTPLETGIVERRPVTGSAARKGDVADDGCEDCIVCPTHNTAFALASGEVRGEWCPYPPVIGKMMGTVKTQANLPTFQIRVRGKNIEVRLASSLDDIKER
mmetsp:Transcript_668/g.1401  ORF Transcript_668/g.1401 Transcript_668/m.1401 type:complete len:528 (-) Transcript_668:64-1647(-)